MNLREAIIRYKKIKSLRKKGNTLEKIGENFNISRERVRQILTDGEPKMFNAHKTLSELEIYLREVRQTYGRSRTREIVRLRDKHACQDCGIVRKTKDVLEHNKKLQTLKGKIKSLDVHHLHGMCGKNSMGYDRVKDISGMVTLCHKCHYNRPEHKTKSIQFSISQSNRYDRRLDKIDIHRRNKYSLA